jgi:hypothetical protein
MLLPALRSDLAVLRVRQPVLRGIYLLARTDRFDLAPVVDALSAA